jgi:hypothetical protein
MENNKKGIHLRWKTWKKMNMWETKFENNQPTSQLTNSMESSPFLEATSCTAIQEFSNILWNPKFHYRVHKSQSLVPGLSQMNPVHITPSYFFNIYPNVVLPPMSGLLVVSFLLDFPPKPLYAFLFSHICATCPTHLILLDLIIVIIFGEI